MKRPTGADILKKYAQKSARQSADGENATENSIKSGSVSTMPRSKQNIKKQPKKQKQYEIIRSY